MSEGRMRGGSQRATNRNPPPLNLPDQVFPVNPVDFSNINPKHHSKSGAFANYGMLVTVRGLYD